MVGLRRNLWLDSGPTTDAGLLLGIAFWVLDTEQAHCRWHRFIDEPNNQVPRRPFRSAVGNRRRFLLLDRDQHHLSRPDLRQCFVRGSLRRAPDRRRPSSAGRRPNLRMPAPSTASLCTSPTSNPLTQASPETSTSTSTSTANSTTPPHSSPWDL